MKKAIKIILFGILLSTSTIYAGKNMTPAVTEVIAVPVESLPFYIAVGGLWGETNKDCVCYGVDGTTIHYETRIEDRTWGGIVRVGYDFNEYIGVEARMLKANINSDVLETTHYGIYIKPMIPIDESMHIYGLLGYGHTEIVTDCGPTQETFKHNGISYGIGLDYKLPPSKEAKARGEKSNWSIWIDYQNLLTNEGLRNHTANVVSFGVKYTF